MRRFSTSRHRVPTDTTPLTAGDEHIKLWRTAYSELVPVTTLESSNDAVLAIAAKDNTVFAGHQGGVVKVRVYLQASAKLPLTRSLRRRSGTSTHSPASGPCDRITYVTLLNVSLL